MSRRHPPREREELAREDYHDPLAGFAGAAPARSALTFRLVLACIGLVFCSLGAAVLLTIVSLSVLAGILAFFAAVAVVDITVVARRKRRGEPG
jgi:hypothetical protein